jgi:putative oxidoreductase
MFRSWLTGGWSRSYMVDRYGGTLGVALLLLRLIVGAAFIAHGLPKVANVAGFAQRMDLPNWLAGVAAWTEVIGGGLLVLGLLTPLAALFIGVEMVVAMLMVHIPAGHPFVSASGQSFELAALYFVVMIAFLLTGPGAYSLDAWIARQAERRAEAPTVTERRRGTV